MTAQNCNAMQIKLLIRPTRLIWSQNDLLSVDLKIGKALDFSSVFCYNDFVIRNRITGYHGKRILRPFQFCKVSASAIK